MRKVTRRSSAISVETRVSLGVGPGRDAGARAAVAEAARRPNIKDAPIKSVEQQGLQAIQRARELLIGECIALSNHLRGILLEFGVAIPQGFASLLRALPEILEDRHAAIHDGLGTRMIEFLGDSQ